MSREPLCDKFVVSNVKADRNGHNTGVINEVAKLKNTACHSTTHDTKIRKRSYQSFTKLNPKPSVRAEQS